MEEVIELRKYKRPNIVVNPELNKHSKDVIDPEKLERVRERLEKHPLPAWFSMSRYSKIQQEHGFEVTGNLKRADATKNTFSLIEMEDEIDEMHYTIRTEPDILNNLVKASWDAPIKVHIRPQITADNLFLFELIEVKVD
jgi:hypothetical protein